MYRGEAFVENTHGIRGPRASSAARGRLLGKARGCDRASFFQPNPLCQTYIATTVSVNAIEPETFNKIS